ncbi:poly A RNA polymerase domain containing protein [Babesia gibsoni]|uniref:Poly A RNA polymerase domain containing protein n=1 Tax=Babesia gibsoni TaxID=33632 RepID=A0AAD8PFX4_BABGI|nr:poly A RNA polymerase domain containing protein [Babesia gibsoni]
MNNDKGESDPPGLVVGSKSPPSDYLIANLSALELERLSAYYGAEVYSMVDDGAHKEIVERNTAMREAVKEFGKAKQGQRSKVDMAGAFINLSRDSTKNEKAKESTNDTSEKCLREILGLNSFYDAISTTRVPFMVMLDVELYKLIEWLSPTEEERNAKEMVILTLEMVVNALFPDARVEVFGSYISGLSLPGSDVDVCIGVEEHDLTALKIIVYALSRLDLLHSFECVFNTPVPVVKAIDKNTGVRIDISVWQKAACNTTSFVRQKCDQFKYMQPIVILLKLFLQMRNLSDTYFGGIGSYLLYCMVLSFLQMHDSSCYRRSDESNTLALLFIDFFYYWGFIRDYEQFTTTVCGLGHVFPRSLLKEKEAGMLSCQSPLEPSIDIGKNAYNMSSARTAFQQAFFALRAKALYIDGRHSNDFKYEKGKECILQQIYDTSHPVFQHRKKGYFKGTAKAAYKYSNLNNFSSSLAEVCQQLRSTIDSGEVDSVFNAQKQLMASLSHKLEGEATEVASRDTPFYIISEAITKQFYSSD